MGLYNIELVGIGQFADSTANYGQITQGIFEDNASNGGLVLTTAQFSNSSSNVGVILSSASFEDTATNSGFLSSDATFDGLSVNNGLVSISATFLGQSNNSGTVYGSAIFSASAVNDTTGIVGDASFTGTAVNAGSATSASFAGASINNGSISISASFTDTASNGAEAIIPVAVFNGNSQNSGIILLSATFGDSAANQPIGIIPIAIFSGNSSNSGVILSSASFTGTSVNTGSATSASFADTASNNGTTSTALFLGSAVNTGIVINLATFADTAINQSSQIQGTVIFSGSAINTGTVEQAIFLGSSVNQGVITLSATFADSALNSGDVQGNAIFADTTTNNGTVSGNALFAETASQGTGQIVGDIDPYVVPNGYYVTGFYFNGVKTQPINYDTVVHLVNTVWYKYDSTGSCLPATGTYDDGTGSIYTFVNGVKGALVSTWYNDESSAAHTITLNGTVTQSDEGNGVKTALFDGTSYIQTNYPGSFNGDFTFETFVKVNNVNTGQFFVSNVTGSSTTSWALGLDNNYIRFSHATAGYNISYAVSSNTWYHVALTRVGTTVNIFVNGVLIDSREQITDFSDTTNLFVGTANSQVFFLDGNLAGLRVVDGTALYTANFQAPTTLPTNITGTQLLLNFGATAAPSIISWYGDTSSLAHTVTLNGSPTQYTEAGGIAGVTTTNGTLIIEDVGSSFEFADGDFTVEMFVNPNSLTSYTHFINYNADADSSGWAVYRNLGPTGIAFIDEEDGNGSWDFFIGTNGPDIPIGSWSHVAITRSGTTANLYLNGTRIGYNDSYTGSIAPITNGKLKIGSFIGGSYAFDGHIAAIRIVKGSALYTTSTYTVPTTLPTAVTGTQLLLNFGATAVPGGFGPSWYGDESSSAHAVTKNGNVTQSDEGNGVIAASFDGNSSLTVETDSTLDISNSDFTISMWAKVASIDYSSATSRHLFGWGSTAYVHGATVGGGFTSSGFYTDFGDGSWGVSGGSQTFISSLALSFNTWYHIEISRQVSTNTVYVFVNGALTQSGNLNITLSNLGLPWCFGRPDKDYPNSILDGKLAGIRIVKGSVLHTTSFAVPTTLPTAITGTSLLLNFGATAAPVVPIWYADESSAARTVTLNGNVTQSVIDSGVYVANFDGSNSFISADNISFGSDSFTIEMFFNPYNLNSFTGLWGQDNGGGDQSKLIAYFYSNSLIVEVHGSGVRVDLSVPYSNIIQHNWNHMAVVREGNTVSLYLNGERVSTSGFTASLGDINQPFIVGDTGEGMSYFTGLIAGIRVVTGTALYSGSTYTIPTTLPTAVTGTQLLLNFGATAVPSIVTWYNYPNWAIINEGPVTLEDLGGGLKVATFDGYGDHLVTNIPGNMSGDFTIESFVKFSADSGNYYHGFFIANANTAIGASNDEWQFGYRAGELQIGSTTVPYGWGYGFNSFDVWHHIALTRQNGVLKLWVDGIKIGDLGGGPTFNSSYPIIIGTGDVAEPNYNDSGRRFFTGQLVGLRVVDGTAVYTEAFIPALPQNVSGTKLLLNFGSTIAPTVTPNIPDDVFTDAFIDTQTYAVTPYSYTTHFNRFYQNNTPYTGTHAVTDFTVQYDEYNIPIGYTTTTRDIWFVVGMEVNVVGSLPSVSYASGIYTINGDVSISNRNLTSMNFGDCIVTGVFDCSHNQLTTLQGSPINAGVFYCTHNLLNSLIGAPTSVNMTFDCSFNALVSLQGAPNNIVNFYCNNNQITTLQGVSGNRTYALFDCHSNLITSLQYGPISVSGPFNCSDNQLTTLQYGPSSVGSFSCSQNYLKNLQGAPNIVSSTFSCTYNQLSSLQGVPVSVGGTFDCSYNQLTTLQYGPSSVGGSLVCNANLLTSMEYAPAYIAGLVACYSNNFTRPHISLDMNNVYWEYTLVDTRKQATYHHYVHGSYYADVDTLVSGTTVLYLASDSNVVAANVTYDTGFHTVTTNSNGVATITDLWYRDISSSPHSVVKTGAPTKFIEGGGVVAALVGPGTLKYVNVNVGSGTEDHTIEFFTKISNPTTYGLLLYLMNGSGQYTLVYGPSLYASSVSYPIFRLTSPYQGLNIDGFNIEPNTWYHIAVVRQNLVFKVYINGICYPFVTQNGASDFTGAGWTMASNTDIQIGYSQYSQGQKIAGLRAIKGTALYTSNFTPPTTLPADITNTQLLLNFDGTNAPNIAPWYKDTSSSNRLVARYGIVSQSDETGGVISAQFNGSSNLQLDYSTDFSFRNDDFTIELFVKLNNSDNKYILSTSYYYNGWVLRVAPGGSTLQFHAANANGSTEAYINTTRSIVDGQWHHVAVVRQNGTATIYIDGQAENSGQLLDITHASGYEYGLHIGGAPSGSSLYILGKLAGIRIVKGTAIYTSNFTVPTSLPTAVSGTVLLMNFGATNVPDLTWYLDDSSAAHTVALQGGVFKSNEGNGVKAAYFDGSSGYITVQNSSNFNFSGDFTIEAFIKPRSYSYNGDGYGYLDIISNGVGAWNSTYHSSWYLLQTNQSAGLLTILAHSVNESNYTSHSSSQGIPIDNNWHHVAVTRNGSAVRMFVDGAVVYTGTDNQGVSSLNPSDPLIIGKGFYIDGRAYYTNSSMTGIRVVKGTALYTTSFTVPTSVPTDITGTELLLNFGATAAPDVTWYLDSSSTPHAVTPTGSVTQVDEGGGVKAANFNGSSFLKYTSQTDFNFGSGDFTIEAFVKPSSSGVVSNQGAIVTTANPSDYQGVFLGDYIVNGVHQFMDFLGDGIWKYAFGVVYGLTSNDFPTLAADDWQHIAWVRSGNTFTLYRNGTSVKSYTANITLTNSNNAISIGGRSVVNAYFVGKITGVRVVKGTAVYTNNFTSPTTLPTAVSGTTLLLNFGATAAPKSLAELDAAALAANLTGFANGTNGRFGYFYVNGVLGNFSYVELTFTNGLAYSGGTLFTGNASWNNQSFVNGRATLPFVGQ